MPIPLVVAKTYGGQHGHIMVTIRYSNLQGSKSPQNSPCWVQLPEEDKIGKFVFLCVCCFLPIHSGLQWTYQPGSHRKEVTQDFPSTFFLRCLP